MTPIRKRVWSGVAALAVASTVAPIFGPTAAYAAGTLAGDARVKAANGSPDLFAGASDTTFTLRLPTGAACEGDSANDGYRWSTYMVPASVDPSTLTFGLDGPIPFTVGAGFRAALYDTASSPVAAQQTANATTAGGPGPIINIPNMTYGVFVPGDIPAGTYNIGIACYLGPAGPTQMKSFWNVQKVFSTSASGGPAQVNWVFGTVPAAPTLDSLTPGDGSLTAAFTATVSDPPTTGFTATATPTGGGAPVTASGAASPIAIGGLTNGAEYSVTVRATNFHGNSAESNALLGTPDPAPRPAVQNLAATPGAPGSGIVDVSWTAPTGDVPTGYEVVVSPDTGGIAIEGTPGTTITVPGTAAEVTGLTPGSSYQFTVTPLHPAPYVGTPASVNATPPSSQLLVQEVTVVRPAGALVLTQVCGRFGALPVGSVTPGFPSGTLPAAVAVTGGAAPDLVAAGGTDPDGDFGQYPYPDTDNDGVPDANYPTYCGIDLGTATFIGNGPGAGQFFATHGRLNQVTIVDTRDLDAGWNVTGTMSAFNNGVGGSFSGNQLGWAPVLTSTTDAFLDGEGNSYDQVAGPGAEIDPNTVGGLGSAKALASAEAQDCTGATPDVCTGGLGIAVLDARFKLLIPVTAVSGNYVGTLTVTVT